MIGGVLENKQQGRIGDVKKTSHFMALERYLVSPDEDGNTDERLLRLRNTYSLNSQVDPNDKKSINEYVLSVRDGYQNFMEEVGRERKPPKTIAKHSVLSFRPDEIEKLESKIKKKHPDISKKNLDIKVLDFVENMAMKYMENHMSVQKKNIKGLNRQYTIAIHGEKDHLHAHIVCNTVCYDNKVYSKTREDLHNQEWCAKMAEQYDFLAQGLNFKKVNDYVLDETQKKELENNVKAERKTKRTEFVKECEAVNINYKDVLTGIKAAINYFKENKIIKPEHINEAFRKENLKHIYDIQPICHVKAGKVTGMSYKLHTKGKVVTIKSSLLPEEYQFKSIKNNMQDYSIDNKAYDRLNSWFDYIQDITKDETATLTNTGGSKKTLGEFKDTYKSRYFELNAKGTGLKFKTGYGSLKNKTVINFVSDNKFEVNILNPATVKEAIRVAKEMGWETTYITTKNAESAMLYKKEAEKQGLKIKFNDEEIERKVNGKPESITIPQRKVDEQKPEHKPEAEHKNKYKTSSRYAPKLKPSFNKPKKKKKGEDEDD